MHPHLFRIDHSTATERCLDAQRLVSELRRRGDSLDDAADLVCQLFGIPRGAARLYVRSHPAWSSAAHAEGSGQVEVGRR